MNYRSMMMAACSVTLGGVLVFALSSCSGTSTCVKSESEAATIASLMPRPKSVVPGKGYSSGSKITYVKDAAIASEGYRIEVKRDEIVIASSDDAGRYYAGVTLAQLKTPQGYPCVKIDDAPAYKWRGMMADEARYFLGKDAVKRILDAMALNKLNVFHWHLVDDQGWRLDVPGFPELVKYGSVRPASPVYGSLAGVKNGKIHYDLDGVPYGPFYYTPADVKEILAYAAERHIAVVPEIEMPGHVRAMLAAKPEFSCVGKSLPQTPRIFWSIEDDVLCVGNDEAIAYLEKIYDAVCEMFPDAPYIHIGGDECPHVRWKECAKCQARIKAENLKNEAGLQAWVTTRIVRHLEKRGRVAIGWDEALAGDVPKSTVGMVWRNSVRGGAGNDFVSPIEALKRGHKLVFTPSGVAYLSGWGGVREDPYAYYGRQRYPKTLEFVYKRFNPAADIPEELRGGILGGQISVWGESLRSLPEFEWKAWPRGAAIAETLWSGYTKRDFAEFSSRVAVQCERLKKIGVNCAPVKEYADGVPYWRPNDKCRPETWFHILGGNISREGLTADLEALKAAGIAGIQLFHGAAGDWDGGKVGYKPKRIMCLSREWEDLIGHIGSECQRLGLSMKIHNCPGWSLSGGPWIAPSNSVRELVSARIDYVSDGKNPMPKLPRLASPDNFFPITEEMRDWRDIKVFAFPTPAGDSASPLKPQSAVTNGNDYVFTFSKPVCIRTLQLPPQQVIDPRRCNDLNASFTLAGDGVTALNGKFPFGAWQDWAKYSIACEKAVTAKVWKLSFKCPRILKLKSIDLLDGVRLDNWETKAGFCLRGMEYPHQTLRDPSAYVKSSEILDVTNRKEPLPPGRWTLLRIGHRYNGMMNSPGPVEARGPECDKMERSGFATIFTNYTGRLLSRALKGGKLKGILIDSWECGCQTWTEKMPQYFREYAKYDVWGMMPALFGYVIDSPEATENFLRDWRGNQSRLIEENYYGEIHRQTRAQGIGAQFETAFGDVIAGDVMKYWKYSDEPMCEYWTPRTPGYYVGDHDFKPVGPCVSAAHLYGKRRVSAESLTSFQLTWNEDFRLFKQVADIHYARGITHVVCSTFTHNPFVGGLPPGSSFGCIGSPFVRLQTWWKFMPELTAYFARCNEALERGVAVVDVLEYLGDNIERQPRESVIPYGNHIKMDYLNYDVLMTRLSVKDGRFVLPDGMSYSVLLLRDGLYLREDTKKRLAELAAAGGKIVRSEKEVDCVSDVALADNPKADTPVLWYHRNEEAYDWYFVVAPSNGFKGKLKFRAETPSAELCDPQSGIVSRYRGWLDLEPYQSMIIKFDKGPAPRPAKEIKRTEVALGDWTLKFPTRTLPNVSLIAWKDLPGSEEEKAYSGAATYVTRFTLDEVPPRLWLDLGRVEAFALVKLNGVEVRKLWCLPYKCNLSGYAKKGENVLEIEVTSTWHNRLTYDLRQPVEKRKTWTTGGASAKSQFKDSGLFGPVKLTAHDAAERL